MPRSTFSRYKEAIESIYGIVIECDRHDNFRYYIENEDVMRSNSVLKWMQSMADLSNFLSDNLVLKDRIFFDKFYREEGYFKIIVKAMRQGCILRFSYTKCCGRLSDYILLAPYFMKYFTSGWHLLGRLENGELGIIPLHRINDISVSDRSFSFDSSLLEGDFVNQCFSFMNFTYVDEKFLIRVNGDQRHCFKDKPLHLTQQVVEDTDDHVDYSLTMKMSPDFIHCMLADCPDLEVLSPQWLIDEIASLRRLGLTLL